RSRVRRSPTAGDLAGDVDLVLDGDRDAYQRQKVAPGYPSVGFVRLLKRPLAIHGGKRVELGVDLLDPAERHLDELPRGDSTTPHQLDLAGQARECDIVIGHASILEALDGVVQRFTSRAVP